MSLQHTSDEPIACIAARYAILTEAMHTQQNCVHSRVAQMWLGTKGIGTSVQLQMTERSSCGMLSTGSA